MKQSLLLSVLLFYVASQGTYLYFDEQGLQGLSESLLQTIATKEIKTGIDYKFNFRVGSIRLSGLKIANMSSDPNQIRCKFDTKKNGIAIALKLEQIIAYADINLKLFGIDAIKEETQISVRKTKINFLILIDENYNKAITLQLNKNKFETFKIGKIKILNGAKWYQKMVRSAMGTVINLFLRGLQRQISKQLAKAFNQYGSSFPNYFNYPEPLDSVRVDFPLLSKPAIENNVMKFDFGCGSNSKTQFQVTNKKFIRVGISDDCVNNIFIQAWKINGLVDISMIAQQLSNIMEIDSKTLSKFFPGFFDLRQPMDVILRVQLDNLSQPQIELKNGNLIASLPFSVDVMLTEIKRIKSLKNGIVIDYEQLKLKEGLYYTQFNMTSAISIDLRKEAKGFIVDLNKIDVTSMKLEDETKFNQQEWDHAQSVLLKFGQSYANQVIYQTMLNPEDYIAGLSPQQISSGFLSDELFIQIQY